MKTAAPWAPKPTSQKGRESEPGQNQERANSARPNGKPGAIERHTSAEIRRELSDVKRRPGAKRTGPRPARFQSIAGKG